MLGFEFGLGLGLGLGFVRVQVRVAVGFCVCCLAWRRACIALRRMSRYSSSKLAPGQGGQGDRVIA